MRFQRVHAVNESSSLHRQRESSNRDTSLDEHVHSEDVERVDMVRARCSRLAVEHCMSTQTETRPSDRHGHGGRFERQNTNKIGTFTAGPEFTQVQLTLGVHGFARLSQIIIVRLQRNRVADEVRSTLCQTELLVSTAPQKEASPGAHKLARTHMRNQHKDRRRERQRSRGRERRGEMRRSRRRNR